MRTVVRVVLWLTVLAACAGVGALFAAHTNPFPPGVEGGAPTTLSPSPSSAPPAKTWTVLFDSASSHRFFYGGRCRSSWTGKLDVVASSDGQINGSGSAQLAGHMTCDFSNAQIQSDTLDLLVHGSTTGSDLVVKIRPSSVSPSGSHDYGGFVATVLRRSLTLAPGQKRIRISVPDATGKGNYFSYTTLTVTCTAGCA